jgi:SAM-dependent methyltransferase
MSEGQIGGNEALQAAHYDKIADAYELHYSDRYSLAYRERFINTPLLHGLDLAGRDVLEALCGSGTVTEDLLKRGARVTGLDISPRMMAVFQERWPDCTALLASILDTGLPDDSFDAITIVGGLHHLHPDVDRAIDELYRILRPGGYLCFMEPHAGSLPDLFRKVWYHFDSTFETNEAAVDVDGLRARNASRFASITTTYQGNVAFLLVFNSMIFRMPLGLKRFYAPPLFGLEAAINRIAGKRFSCFVVSQWQKRAVAAPGRVDSEVGMLSR